MASSNITSTPQSHTLPSEREHEQDQRQNFSITPVTTPEDLADTKTLFTAYTTSLNIDLTFQDYATELATLPGKYSPSQGGALLLARNTSTREAVGCIALRRLPSSPSQSQSQIQSSTSKPADNTNIAELKRLYVLPSTRRTGLGRRLTEAMITQAQNLSFDEIRLDTLAHMVAAQNMYLDLGFVDIEPYCYNPIEGVRFLGLKLSSRENEETNSPEMSSVKE